MDTKDDPEQKSCIDYTPKPLFYFKPYLASPQQLLKMASQLSRNRLVVNPLMNNMAVQLQMKVVQLKGTQRFLLLKMLKSVEKSLT